MSNETLIRHLRAMPGGGITARAADAIERLESELENLLNQMEAIGAGGVSGQRITSVRSDTALYDALFAIVQEVEPGGAPYSLDSYLPEHLVEKAREAIAKANGGKE